ncbi:MAG: ABC-F family ATP-binding cassette domain-containing protein [Acholeplasmatales bacterium]|nr:ABC-F family ATP-binding cassette domain-containing protein [Acholeplasmatales bacterium]
MMNITFDNVSFKYIERKILDSVNFSITDNDKIGIVGVNGTGKTTLLKLFMEIEKPNSGSIIKTGGIKINYLPQDPVFPNDKSLLSIVMEESTKEHPILEYEAKSILSKMGFNDYDINVTNFSGGQLKRLALAKVLVTYCDILILDEPTNHLDNELIIWLEKYLIKWKKGLLMVTHDRYFLQRVCNKMMEIDFGKIYLYDANYEAFLSLKAERLNNQHEQQKKLKSILKHETEWMNRTVEARRTKSKSRIERFEQLSKIEFNEHAEMEFSSISTRLGKKLISMQNGFKAFGDKKLFNDFSFDLNRNDIIGIVGDNGAGKTTLFKILLEEESLDSGILDKGETLKIGYFSQHLELINPEIRVIDYIKDYVEEIETLDGTISASKLLEKFLFTSELQYSKVKMLSGGEKRRLQLVKVLISNPNVLLFDEPTNDLDLYTLEILEDYLLDFKGPILVISHDRYFLDKICNKLFVFRNGNIIESNKSFSEFLDSENITISNSNKQDNNIRRNNKMPASLRNELEKITNDMPKLEAEIEQLKIDLSKEATDYRKILELQQSIEDLNNSLEKMMERYFELEEIKESYKIK